MSNDTNDGSEDKEEFTVIAQQGEGRLIYRVKGQKTIIFDRESPLTQEIKIGSRVTGIIKQEDERRIILEPTKIEPPIEMEITANYDREGKVVGFTPDHSRIVFFYTEAPYTDKIQAGDKVKGVIQRDEPNFIWLYPTEVIPGSGEILGAGFTSPKPIHPFVPIVLNELISVSRGHVRTEILGVKIADQAFEDLIASAFRVLECGILTQLGYRASGRPFPDGDIFCPSRENPKFVVLYDAKSRSGSPGYDMTLNDKRAFEDYLRGRKYTQVQNRAFVVISSSFADEPEQLNGGTLTFMTASALAKMVSWKVMNPRLVHETSYEPIFFSGKIITDEYIDKWAKDLRLSQIPV